LFREFPPWLYPKSSSLYPTRPCSCILPWAQWIHWHTEVAFLFRPISLLSHHPLLGLPRCLLPSVFRRVCEISKTYCQLRHVFVFVTLVCICVVRLLFVLFCVLFVCKCVLPPGDNPIAVNKYITCVSVLPPVRMEQLGSHWTDFHESWYLSIFRKSVENIQISLKSDRNNGYFTCRTAYIFVCVSPSSLNVSDKILQKIKTHNSYPIVRPPPKIVPFMR